MQQEARGLPAFFIGICKKARLKEKKREGFHSFIKQLSGLFQTSTIQ